MRFVDERAHLKEVMEGFGVPLAEANSSARIASLKARLQKAGAEVRNDGKSVAYGALSPACERCRTGVKSVSEFISLACNQSCWFCFNPNQHDYQQYRTTRKDWSEELKAYCDRMDGLDYVALTGGEPLLFQEETLDFFRTARAMNPSSHLRLYTSGYMLDEPMLSSLAEAGLTEIRFSIKLDEPPSAQSQALDRIRAARSIIPQVMVEMPVIPGTHDAMSRLLRYLDEAGIFGINLLELCFPLHNAEAYRKRGLTLKPDPYRIPYDYGYAGALPVAGSEELALSLMLEEIERGTTLGLHYCSLENKNTAQIYAQNRGGERAIPHYRFSEKTFFYETVRAFDDDALYLAECLSALGADYATDDTVSLIMFDPIILKDLPCEAFERKLFLASGIIEESEEGKRFREVGLELVEPEDQERWV